MVDLTDLEKHPSSKESGAVCVEIFQATGESQKINKNGSDE